MRRLIIFCTIVCMVSLSLPVNGLASENNDDIAFLSLERVAQRSKFERILGGSVALGLGGLFSISADEDSEFGDFYSFMGGLLAGVGVVSLILKSPPEREYESVIKISDELKRENMAYQSLGYLADQGKQNRTISGIGYGALAIYNFKDSSDYYEDSYCKYLTILYGGMSIYSFIVPSYAEQLYEQVHEVKEKNYQVSLEPSFDTIGAKVAFSF